MNPPPFTPEFNVKMEGHAFAHFTGERDPETIKKLYAYLRANNWKGCLKIHFPGNGGVTDVMFEEIKKMTVDKQT